MNVLSCPHKMIDALLAFHTQAVELDGPGQAVALAHLAVDAVSMTTRLQKFTTAQIQEN